MVIIYEEIFKRKYFFTFCPMFYTYFIDHPAFNVLFYVKGSDNI